MQIGVHCAHSKAWHLVHDWSNAALLHDVHLVVGEFLGIPAVPLGFVVGLLAVLDELLARECCLPLLVPVFRGGLVR